MKHYRECRRIGLSGSGGGDQQGPPSSCLQDLFDVRGELLLHLVGLKDSGVAQVEAPRDVLQVLPFAFIAVVDFRVFVLVVAVAYGTVPEVIEFGLDVLGVLSLGRGDDSCVPLVVLGDCVLREVGTSDDDAKDSVVVEQVAFCVKACAVLGSLEYPYVEVAERGELLECLGVAEHQVVGGEYFASDAFALKVFQRSEQGSDSAHRNECDAHEQVVAAFQFPFDGREDFLAFAVGDQL